MGLVRLAGKGFGYLMLATVVLAFFPVFVAYAVGTNWRGVTDTLSKLPGIEQGGGVKTGAIALGYGVILWGPMMLASGSPAEDTRNGTETISTPEPTVTQASDQSPTADISTTTVRSTTTPEPSASVPTSTATPLPTATETPVARGLTVTVTEVTDGDTIDIQYQNGTSDTVRLLGVDTPEVYGGNDPTEFEGVPDSNAGSSCLSTEGDEASEYAKQTLSGKTIQLKLDSQSDGRGSYGRLLAYIIVDGQNFNYQLVSQGYARVYDSEFEQSERFYSAESSAQDSTTGVWQCRNVETETSTGEESKTGPLTVSSVHADAQGNDHDNLNDEYVTFQNNGDSSLDIGGWTVSDSADHTYTVPTGTTVEAGDTITLYTGSGTDSSNSIYWNSDTAIWNNAGDTVIVTDESGSTVIEHEYS